MVMEVVVERTEGVQRRKGGEDGGGGGAGVALSAGAHAVPSGAVDRPPRNLKSVHEDRNPSILGPVVPSFRALSGRLQFTVRRFNKDSFSPSRCSTKILCLSEQVDSFSLSKFNKDSLSLSR